MYCPNCGQQQATSDLRFCSRCGFLLEGVIALLANGGVLPVTNAGGQGRKLSPRQKGVRQGALLMLSTVLIVPLVAIISAFIIGAPKIFIPIAAITCFLGGLMRILYALLMEESTPSLAENPQSFYVPPGTSTELGARSRPAALPPQRSMPVSGWRRADTSELVTPPSVTEKTTRLLNEKEKPDTSQ
jgi:hypothetical protein